MENFEFAIFRKRDFSFGIVRHQFNVVRHSSGFCYQGRWNFILVSFAHNNCT